MRHSVRPGHLRRKAGAVAVQQKKRRGTGLYVGARPAAGGAPAHGDGVTVRAFVETGVDGAELSVAAEWDRVAGASVRDSGAMLGRVGRGSISLLGA